MSAARFMMIAGAPAPVGPFSHAVEVDGWVFLTGQMPTNPSDDGAPLSWCWRARAWGSSM